MKPQSTFDLSVVVPVYNGAGTVAELTERLCSVLESLDRTFEIIFVNDGSRDDSWMVLCGVQRKHPDTVVLIDLMRNFGQHNALMCGFRHGRGELIVTMDDDLQNPPEEIPKLLAAIVDSEADLVFGRYDSNKQRGWRQAGSWLVHVFYRIVFKSTVMPTSFRIIRRPLVECILSYDLNYTFIDGLLAWNTQQVTETPVEHHPRSTGRSGYSVGRLLLLAFNLFTNFSLLPLQVVSALGLLTAGCGLLAGMYYLLQRIFADTAVPGYASTVVAILTMGGVQLLALGVIGEYLGRVHLNINRKPQYTVRATKRMRRTHSRRAEKARSLEK